MMQPSSMSPAPPQECGGGPAVAAAHSGVRYVTFNQDQSAVCVGCDSGFRLFSLNNVDKLDETFYEGTLNNVVIVERLFLSSLVVTVSQSSPRKLSLCHFKKGTEICNYSYPNRILSVRLNRKRLVVCLTDSLFIHNIRDMKVVHTIKDTPSNPKGVCCLCASDDCGYLAYPGSSTIGEVQVFDAHHLVPVITVPAHDSPVAVMAFSRTGERLATASEKGTVIRVFTMPDGNKAFEFRRGVKRCVTINCLAFSSDSLFLAASSNTETVHMFKLEKQRSSLSSDPSASSIGGTLSGSGVGGGGGVGGGASGDKAGSAAAAAGGASSWIGYFGQAIMESASFLPSNMGEVFTQGRAAFHARLPVVCSEAFNVCAMAWINKLPRLIVASTTGYLYIYNIDLGENGDCVLIKQHRIDGGGAAAAAAAHVSRASSANADSPKPMLLENDILPPSSSPINIYSSPGTGGGSVGHSYAGAVSPLDRAPAGPGSPSSSPAGTPKLTAFGSLTHSPGRPIKLDDDNEFPPMSMHTDD